MKIPLVDLQKQYKNHKTEINNAVQKVLNRGDFILGEDVEKFESEFANFCGAKYCVGLDSGSSALELGMRALGIKEEDEVITPVNSFIASSSAISFIGARPVWVDCDPKTYNIDTSKIEDKINKKTKAIMPVHLYGQPAEMDEIKRIAKSYNLYVVEDACQAHGAEYKGTRVGNFGDFAAFSFYPGKNLGAYGDAGALVTNNKKIYEKVKMMRNYGQSKKYYHDFIAWNRRLDTIQAAVLRVKLRHLNRWNKLRKQHADLYTNLLSNLPVITPYEKISVKHVYHLYVIQVKKRERLLKYLQKKGIGAGIHYPIPIHLQKAYFDCGVKRGNFPVSERMAKRLISLPMFFELTNKQINYIAGQIKQFYK